MLLLSPIIFTGLAGLAAAVAPSGYTIMTDSISWQISDITPGSTHILNGTVEQVRTQILAINPDYVFAAAPPPTASNFNSSYSMSGICVNETDADATSSASAAGATANSLTGRAAGDFYCDIFPKAYCYYIADQIIYLYGVKGVPKNGPGPGNCGRVSCSWDTEVLWCNDNKNDYSLANFTVIAEAAKEAMKKCDEKLGGGCYYDHGFQNWYVPRSAQLFMDGGWNVIVRETDPDEEC